MNRTLKTLLQKDKKFRARQRERESQMKYKIDPTGMVGRTKAVAKLAKTAKTLKVKRIPTQFFENKIPGTVDRLSAAMRKKLMK